MSFHTPVKALNPVDTKLPDHVVKGAIIVDEHMPEWNSAVVLDGNGPMSTFIIIDKQSGDLDDVLHCVAQELKLPIGEKYSLVFEEPCAFLTKNNLDRVAHGFMLTVTAAPSHYVRRIDEVFSALCDVQKVEWALIQLNSFSADPCFVSSFYELSSIQRLYDLLNDDRVNGIETCLSLCLHSLSAMLELRVNNVSWESVPQMLVNKLATLVTGRAKREDSSVLIALPMIEHLVNCNSDYIRHLVLSEVPLQALIRHLEKSDERVVIAALSLMNALYKNSDDERRKEIIKHLGSVPFRMAVAGSVLREGRSKDRSLLDQLVPLQRLLIGELNELSCQKVDQDEIKALLNREVVRNSVDDSQLTKWATILAESSMGRLALTFISNYADQHEEDLRILVSENSMRVGGSRWQLVPMCLHCLTIVAALVGVYPSSDDSVEDLIELLYSCDAPFDGLFATTVQLFHRTWREMQASQAESEKVANVVREQLRRASRRRPSGLTSIDDFLIALPYWKMKDLWKREQIEKENDQMGSEAVNELRNLLRPSIEQLIRTNRKNFMKQGYTFKRHLKGKTSHKDMYSFWKLDLSEKILIMIDTDSDPYIEAASHAGTIRRVVIKDISSVEWGDENQTSRKSAVGLRTIRMVLHGGETIAASTQSDRTLCTWVDGLCDLVGNSSSLSRDASRIVDRFLNVELRLRLVDIPSPQPPIIPPQLPNDYEQLLKG